MQASIPVALFVGMGTLAVTSSCSTEAGPTLETRLDGATVRVTLSRAAPARQSENETLVYGRVTITSDRRIARADLDCIALSFGTRRTREIYVNRIASVLPDRFQADDSGKIETPVYWLVPQAQPGDLDLNGAAILAGTAGGSCITYATD